MIENLKINNNLIKKAKKLGKHLSKKETVTRALEEYIKYLEQMKVTDLFGKIEFDENFLKKINSK